MLALADDLAVACFEGEVAFAVGCFFDFEIVLRGSVCFDGFDAIECGGFVFVSLALENDFAVARFHAEMEFLGFFALEEFVHDVSGVRYSKADRDFLD